MMKIKGSEPGDLDSLVKEFQEWQQAYGKLHFEKVNLQMDVKELQRLQKENTGNAQQMKNGSRQLQEQIDKLHQVLNTRCDLQDENRTLRLEVEKSQEESRRLRQETEVEREKLLNELEVQKSQHQGDMKDLMECHIAQVAADKASYERSLLEKSQVIQELEQKAKEIEREKHAEMVKLRLEYDAKLLKLHTQTTKVQQKAAASSNQEIFRKKLQHTKSEYEREVSGLKRTITDLESQLASRNSAAGNVNNRTGQSLMKKRKF